MVTPQDLEPESTGCQTCALTATPKSPARWHGSQSTYSSVATITSLHCPHLREVQPCASRTHQPCFSHPEHPTHKCFTHLFGPTHRGQPTWGSLTQPR